MGEKWAIQYIYSKLYNNTLVITVEKISAFETYFPLPVRTIAAAFGQHTFKKTLFVSENELKIGKV